MWNMSPPTLPEAIVPVIDDLRRLLKACEGPGFDNRRDMALMRREGAQARARRYVAESRVIVHRVGPGIVAATCRGDGTVHHLG